jgi:hypothetical protein
MLSMLFLIFFRVKDSELVSNAFNVDPLYLKHDHQGKIPDYRVSKKTDNRIMTFILPVTTFVFTGILLRNPFYVNGKFNRNVTTKFPPKKI